jgi:flagellin
MSSNITLTAGIRNNLLSLQDTATLLAQTQQRLATGKKVNSPLDNPNNFFTADGLSRRADDLSSILDGVSNAVQTLKAADTGLKTLTNLVNQAKSLANQALQAGSNAQGTFTSAIGGGVDASSVVTTGGVLTFQNGSGPTVDFTIADGATLGSVVNQINAANAGIHASFITDGNGDSQVRIASTQGQNLTVSGTAISAGTIDALTGIAAQAYNASASAGAERAALATQFDDLRTQIDQLITDTGFNGKNLLNGDALSVIFNEKSGSAQSKLDINGVTFDSAGIGLAASANNWASEGDINTSLDNVKAALDTVSSQAAKFGSNLGVVQARQDFTKSLISTLQTGADNLTLADTNEEAANLLALQTRNQLSQTALSLASQQNQSVLRLFA